MVFSTVAPREGTRRFGRGGRPDSSLERTITDRSADRADSGWESLGDLGVFGALATHSGDALLVSRSTADDPTIRIAFANDAFFRLTGFDGGAIRGQSPGILVGPDTNLDTLRNIEAALRTGTTVSDSLLLYRHDQTPFHVEAFYVRHDGADGSTWYASTFRELATYGAQAATWRSDAWAQAIVKGISDVVAVADADSTVSWASPSVRARLGYEPEEIIGESVFGFVHPDQVELARAEWSLVAAEGTQERPTDYRVRMKDGGWKLMNISANPQFDHPAVRGMILTLSDLSERADAEDRLRRNEQWAQALVQGGSDLVVVQSADGRVKYASPAVKEVLGFTPEEFVGRGHLDLVHPEDVGLLRRVLRPSDVQEGAYQIRAQHRDGSWRLLDLAIADMSDDSAVEGVVINIRDVTDRRQAEQLLSEQADLLEAIARGAPLEITLQKITQMIENTVEGTLCAIGVLDTDGTIRVRAAPSLPRQIINVLDELSPSSGPAQHLRDQVDGSFTTYDLENESRFRDTEVFRHHGLAACRVAPLLAPGSSDLIGALTVFDRDSGPLDELEQQLLSRATNLASIAIERRRFESTLEYQALYDSLTGLPNRTLLVSRIADSLERAARLGSGVAVLFLDLDRFKVINDSLGHELGDQLLQMVADRLREPLRPGDTLGRFGADEFMVVCNRIPNEAGAAAAADRFGGVLDEPFELDGGAVFVTASIGIAFAEDGNVSPESLIRKADVAMYRAKDQGRAQHVVFLDTLDNVKVEQLALEQALRNAIERGEFELHFQPVVELADGSMTHAEALVRWQRPGHGMVMPGLFIPLAEETGLVVPLGWWVLEEACNRLAAWPDVPGKGEVEIAVNLSAKQLASPELLEIVSGVLARTGVEAHRLCFEITESDLVRDVNDAVISLNRLKELGVQIAIDDFGTGYASLDYIRHFTMADYLKIDRAFVDGVEKEGSQEAAICTAAIALAKSLGLRVIAEGVETIFQKQALEALECDLAQGYLFSRPVPVHEAIELMTAKSG
ncbi:MAG: EAL domain-containing protein [Actinobacteria bacterium]|nr:EAL domain-containing protein [Actinomycetota bacterium]